MTPERLFEIFEEYGLHIGDGMGDDCSGTDENAMHEAAIAILKEIEEQPPNANPKKES